MLEENEYVGTKEAAELTGLTQQTIQKRCRQRYYITAEQDAVGCPWRILRKEVIEKMNNRRVK